jgi:selenophosphate synthetase-related protein
MTVRKCERFVTISSQLKCWARTSSDASFLSSGREHQVEVVANVLVQVGQAVAVLAEVQFEPVVVVIVLEENIARVLICYYVCTFMYVCNTNR